ncbi:helix-turn-helix transcriptional regulator [Chondrinema litorale]|uniref:helix-turn-helix transcriptional regulator n=1 Tax=Chondrinema litorale TaxID=2994555 RepID=UPI002542AEC5|nr:AraC family transcriptional regulator [Chondrinema litorale]UZR99468.1 AraC family transcriptional regulator [Chondrinema litorale]
MTSLVEYYFFIDVQVSEADSQGEYIIPFPRITFGYFFDHPFLVTNHDLNQQVEVDMVISRITSHKITVKPLSDRIKIIGAHVKPFALAYLTNTLLEDLPWLIDTQELFKEQAAAFKRKIKARSKPNQMFDEVENIFLESVLVKDLSVITQAVEMVEKHAGEIKLDELANAIGVTSRTLRNQFYKYVGCAPKEYINLVKLYQSVYQMHHSNDSLTSISHDTNYFDQAHFINTIKRITGKSPGKLRKEMPDFRFLQF